MQRRLGERFHLSVYQNFLRDVYFTIIDKTDPKKPTKQNYYRIHTPEAKALMGLNVEAGLQT